jgi:hypothetical protein
LISKRLQMNLEAHDKLEKKKAGMKKVQMDAAVKEQKRHENARKEQEHVNFTYIS